MDHKDLIYNKEAISIYVHYPFCEKKCPYCDFNSYSLPSNLNNEDYVKAYLNELIFYENFLKNKKITSVFFGGGTPSLMPLNLVEKIMQAIVKINNNMLPEEVSLEANPSSLTKEKLLALKQFGINRISIGVQSFSDDNLKFLGRIHSVKEAITMLNLANEIFDNTSFDLITALPNQNLDGLKKELLTATTYIKTHFSIYQLTVEENTPFYKNNIKEAGEEKGTTFWQTTNQILIEHNVFPYEISNFAKNNKKSIHNLNYWNSGLYLGLGAGASSRLYNPEQNSFIALKNHNSPSKWCNALLQSKPIYQEEENLSLKEHFFEYILNNLRLYSSVPKIIINSINKEYLDVLLKENLFTKENESYYTTERGKLLLNYLTTNIAENLNI